MLNQRQRVSLEHIEGEVQTDQILRALYLTQVHLEEEGDLPGASRFTKVTGPTGTTQPRRTGCWPRGGLAVACSPATDGWKGILLTSPNWPSPSFSLKRSLDRGKSTLGGPSPAAPGGSAGTAQVLPPGVYPKKSLFFVTLCVHPSELFLTLISFLFFCIETSFEVTN